MKKVLYRVVDTSDGKTLDHYFPEQNLRIALTNAKGCPWINRFDRLGIQFNGLNSGTLVRLPGDLFFRPNIVVSAPFNATDKNEENINTLIGLLNAFAEAEYCHRQLFYDDTTLTAYSRQQIKNMILELKTGGGIHSGAGIDVGLLARPKDPELEAVIANIQGTKDRQLAALSPEESVVELLTTDADSVDEEFLTGVSVQEVFKCPEQYQLTIRHSGFNFYRFVLDPSDNVYKSYFDHCESLDGIDTQEKLINLIVSLGRGYNDRPSLYQFRTSKQSDAEFKKAIFYHNLILLEYRNRSYFPNIETELFRYQFTKKLPD